MNERIKQYLEKLEFELLSTAKRELITISREWAKKFPIEAGVYILREGGEICYVGETGSIRGRILDLLDTRNHVIRRKIGELKFSNTLEFKKASSRKKYPQVIEERINQVLEDNFEISVKIVSIGRKELEEQIIEKHKPKYNTKGRRKSIEKAYSVEEIRKDHKNAYQPWTQEDDEELEQMHQEGKTIKEMMERFGRNSGSINSRLKKIVGES